MLSHRRFVIVVAMCAFVGAAGIAHAQLEIDNNFKYNSGQDAQPA